MASKKILILSMTGGFGHIRAGQALLDYATHYLSGIEAVHVDIADLDTFFKKFTTTFYNAMSKKMPFLWGAAYKLSNFKSVSFIAQKIGGINWFFSQKIRDYLLLMHPDAIIFTNVVPLPLFAPICRKVLPHINMGVVVTDYHAHHYYKSEYIDYYFVANHQVQSDLVAAGVSPQKIVVSGIPINPKFYGLPSVTTLKIKYNIKNNLPVVLFIASFRISKSDLVDIIGQLLACTPTVNLIFIANGNLQFYNMVKDAFGDRENFTLISWTDVIEEYMSVSDVIITKAGGLTVSECLTLKKPMIIVRPIQGQEEYNAEFIEKNNAGVKVESIQEIIEVLPKMLLRKDLPFSDLVPLGNPSQKIFEYMLK